mgnify:CR=1 FL=1
MCNKILSDIKILNGWQIKLLITSLMILNHLQFGYHFVSPKFQDIFWLISRCVAPMFAFFVVEGIFYTKNLKKYLLHILIWTIIVTIGNTLIQNLLTTYSTNINESDLYYLAVRTNICFTLLLGALCISFYLWSKDKKSGLRITYQILAVIFFTVGIFLEWGLVLLPFMVITYYFKSNIKRKIQGYALIEVISIVYRHEFLFFTVFPLIALYNGKRGPKNLFTKYFFYAFYPIHLWIIAILNFILMN